MLIIPVFSIYTFVGCNGLHHPHSRVQFKLTHNTPQLQFVRSLVDDAVLWQSYIVGCVVVLKNSKKLLVFTLVLFEALSKYECKYNK